MYDLRPKGMDFSLNVLSLPEDGAVTHGKSPKDPKVVHSFPYEKIIYIYIYIYT